MTATQLTRSTARVAVRVPRDAGENLLEDARRRLERADPVETVTVEEMCGLEPALAATVVQLEVGLTATTAEATALEAALADTPGTERVETVRPA